MFWLCFLHPERSIYFITSFYYFPAWTPNQQRRNPQWNPPYQDASYLGRQKVKFPLRQRTRNFSKGKTKNNPSVSVKNIMAKILFSQNSDRIRKQLLPLRRRSPRKFFKQEKFSLFFQKTLFYWDEVPARILGCSIQKSLPIRRLLSAKTSTTGLWTAPSRFWGYLKIETFPSNQKPPVNIKRAKKSTYKGKC